MLYRRREVVTSQRQKILYSFRKHWNDYRIFDIIETKRNEIYIQFKTKRKMVLFCSVQNDWFVMHEVPPSISAVLFKFALTYRENNVYKCVKSKPISIPREWTSGISFFVRIFVRIFNSASFEQLTLFISAYGLQAASLRVIFNTLPSHARVPHASQTHA